MNSGNWQIGVSGESLDQLLSGEQAGMSLWFLAGYVKGITDSQALLRGERRMVIEPDGDQGWRLRSDAVDAVADSELEAQA
jgi:hypothetical protein